MITFKKSLNGKMKIYRNLIIKKKHKNSVVAIGNFDGIHLGQSDISPIFAKHIHKEKIIGLN